MSNSATVTANINATVSGAQFLAALSASIVPAGSGGIVNNQSIATSATQVLLTGISSPAYVAIKNTDPTNTVNVTLESTALVTPQTIQPGGFCVLTGLGASPVYAKASGGAVEITVTAFSI